MRLNEDGARLSQPALDFGIRHSGEPYCPQAPHTTRRAPYAGAYALARGSVGWPARRRRRRLRRLSPRERYSICTGASPETPDPHTDRVERVLRRGGAAGRQRGAPRCAPRASQRRVTRAVIDSGVLVSALRPCSRPPAARMLLPRESGSPDT
jgi:hypothetical protein